MLEASIQIGSNGKLFNAVVYVLERAAAQCERNVQQVDRFNISHILSEAI